jgi:hypothetical protein
MGDASGWDYRRTVTLAMVIALHLGLLASLLRSPPQSGLIIPTSRPLELVELPPSPRSKIIPDNFRPHRIGSDITRSIAPPVVGSLSMAPAMSGTEGNGDGVDWRAEARRALQAFEIRSHKDPNAPAPSRSTTDDDWWPHARHRAGEQYKTANGDWIIWIDSNCYQVAAAASSNALVTVMPQTVCSQKDAELR